jgi:uncharacterized protein (DUF1684 family)
MRPRGKTPPDELTLGDLTMLVLQSGSRHAVRLYDKQHSARNRFAGLRWYPLDAAYRIQADYIPHPEPQTLAIVNVVGDSATSLSPGMVSFSMNGQRCHLIAELRGESLFYNFRDRTNGDTTYGGGRFLYSGLPDNGLAQPGVVTLDFNRATNPYCGYTPYAICPVPPPANALALSIEAGEMRYLGKV